MALVVACRSAAVALVVACMSATVALVVTCRSAAVALVVACRSATLALVVTCRSATVASPSTSVVWFIVGVVIKWTGVMLYGLQGASARKQRLASIS